MVSDSGQTVVKERLMVRKFADAAAHARDEADAVVVVTATSDLDGTTLEHSMAEIGRDDPGFAHWNAEAARVEATYRQQQEDRHGTD